MNKTMKHFTVAAALLTATTCLSGCNEETQFQLIFVKNPTTGEVVNGKDGSPLVSGIILKDQGATESKVITMPKGMVSLKDLEEKYAQYVVITNRSTLDQLGGFLHNAGTGVGATLVGAGAYEFGKNYEGDKTTITNANDVKAEGGAGGAGGAGGSASASASGGAGGNGYGGNSSSASDASAQGGTASGGNASIKGSGNSSSASGASIKGSGNSHNTNVQKTDVDTNVKVQNGDQKQGHHHGGSCRDCSLMTPAQKTRAKTIAFLAAPRLTIG